MLGLLAQTSTSLLVLALLFALLVAAAFAVDNEAVRTQLRRQPWFIRFELLSANELRFRGMVSLGFGVCSFAALLSLRLLFPGSDSWAALALGVLTVAATTLGAALLERADALHRR